MIKCTISDAGGANGDSAVNVLVRDDSIDREIQRRIRLHNEDEVGAMVDEVESTFGPEAAGDARSLLDEAAEKADEPKDPAALLEPITAGQLIQDNPELNPIVIENIVREGEVVNFASATKVGKTFLGMGVSLCVATGRPLFDRFQVNRGDVLYMDFELHPPTLAHRIKSIASAMGMMRAEYEKTLQLLSMRGRLMDMYQLAPFFSRIASKAYRLIVVDALYRTFPERFEENSNGAFTALYNQLDRYAAMTGAAILILHHTTKGNQSAKEVTDLGSGGSAQSRCPDGHFGLRRHEEKDVLVMEGGLRSFAPLPAFCLRWTYPTFSLAPECDPAKLKRDPRNGGRPKKTELAVMSPEDFARQFVTDVPKVKDLIIARATTGKTVSARDAAKLLLICEDQRLIFRHKITGDTKTYYATKAPDPTLLDMCAHNSRARTPRTPVTGRAKRPRNGN